MRVRYVGRDNRIRVAEANRFKFMPDGIQLSDPRNERDDTIQGPVIIFHTRHIKGGKRTVVKVPQDFEFTAVQKHLLENGWIDLIAYPAVSDSYY